MERCIHAARRQEALRPSTAVAERGVPPCSIRISASGRPGASYLVSSGSVTVLLRSDGWRRMGGTAPTRPRAATGSSGARWVVRRSADVDALRRAVGGELLVLDVEEDPDTTEAASIRIEPTRNASVAPSVNTWSRAIASMRLRAASGDGAVDAGGRCGVRASPGELGAPVGEVQRRPC